MQLTAGIIDPNRNKGMFIHNARMQFIVFAFFLRLTYEGIEVYGSNRR